MTHLTQPIGAVIEGLAGGEPVNVSGEMTVMPTGTYLGEQVISGNDASQNATLPDGTKAIWVSARGGAAYVSVNDDAAAASSGMYIPEDAVRIIGPFDNITSLGVYAATGDSVHLLFEG